MANLLSDAKRQQVIALGQLGWTLRRIQAATGVQRETDGPMVRHPVTGKYRRTRLFVLTLRL
jgi:hypothetical protein